MRLWRVKDGAFMVLCFLAVLYVCVAGFSRENALVVLGLLLAALYVIFYTSDIMVFIYSICARNAARAEDISKVKLIYRNIYLISPGSISGKVAHAVLLTLEREWHRAEKLYHEILSLRPHDLEMAYNLAYVLVRQDKITEAVTWLRLIIAARPQWELPYQLLAEVA
ncbi:MAG: tetratricopeptide repeat protein [Thermoanaerobacteraceae bacterium]|nr:tetratricopeptide repeat protein [Thermoanaerobacteraceae bacterium]